jgi:uncharacterized protein
MTLMNYPTKSLLRNKTISNMLQKILFVFLFLSTLVSYSQSGIPDPQSPPRLVNNFSKEFPNFITPAENAYLEEKLSQFNDSTSNQIVIVIIDDLAGYEPAEFAYRIGDKWGVGQKKEDNGIVILIKPTGGKGQRKFFIATGSGLEGAIPDYTCRQIEEQELIPYFKKGEYFKGLDNTTNVLMSLAKGEFNSKQYAKKKNEKKGSAIIVLLIIALFVFIFFRNGGGKGGRGMTMGPGSIFFMTGGFGGRSGGSGFGGGSGGFGGFGGGGFSGGGSGGSW